jgi:DNA polymerase-1
MVAESISLPNVRKMFIPDEGYTIIDADLEKADVQVVAYEANDEELKQIFREGKNLHVENAKMIFGLKHVEKSSSPNSPYHKAKQGCHLTNYGGKARMLASALGITVHEADMFQKRWFAAHPRILAWHKRIERELRQFRKVVNPFGFERYYFDRVESIFTEALAWVPQSTVALVTNKGLINIDKNLPDAQILIQVHDSLVLQIPTNQTPNIYQTILSHMLIPIPYDDPLTIPVSIAASEISWGDCEPVEV